MRIDWCDFDPVARACDRLNAAANDRRCQRHVVVWDGWRRLFVIVPAFTVSQAYRHRDIVWPPHDITDIAHAKRLRASVARSWRVRTTRTTAT